MVMRATRRDGEVLKAAREAVEAEVALERPRPRPRRMTKDILSGRRGGQW